jgi:hypothetical protein
MTFPPGIDATLTRLNLLGFFPVAFSLDEHAVGILAVIAANVRLDEVATIELWAMRAIEQMARIIRRWLVICFLSEAAPELGASAERRVMVQTQIFNFTL